MSSRTVTIDGLSDKDSFISDAWSQLYQLMQSAAQQLQWKTGKLFHSEGSELGRISFLVFLILDRFRFRKLCCDSHSVSRPEVVGSDRTWI